MFAAPSRSRFSLTHAVCVVAMAAALGAPAAARAAALTDSFDSSSGGWRITGDNAAAWSATGGNPTGCVYVNDLATGDMCYAVAPAPWLGDWSALGASDTLRADLYLHNSSGGAWVTPEYIFRLSGPGGMAHALSGIAYLPPDGVWTTYRVSLTPAAWTLDSGSWTALLADVQSLRLLGEFVTGDEDVRFDNVSLSRAPAHAFAPCVAADFNDGTLGDWSFANTGGVSNPGGGGNTRGFCQVADGTGTSYAYAPAVFLGDWSALDGVGEIAVDIRVVSAAGALLDLSSFVRLSGAGGVAHIGLPAGSVPASTRVWQTVALPLTAAAWTMESGTWAALLADVGEFRIQAEFYGGTDKIGLDNVCRRLPSCAPVDRPVATHLAGAQQCATYSLVGVGAPAFDALDGAPYALVDSSGASGGGLYPLAGATPGVRLQAYESPSDVLFTATGDAFISEDTSGIVYRRTAAGVSSAWVSGFHTGDDDPAGLCIAPPGFDGPQVDPGDILVTDWGYSGPDEVWAFSPLVAEGERQVMADPGTVDFQDIAAGDGVAYLCDALNGAALSVLAPDGVLVPLALGTPLSGIVSVVADTALGRLYVAETATQTVRAIDMASGAVSLLADGFVSLRMCALAIDGPARKLLIADTGAARVYQVCLPAATAVRDPRVAPENADAPPLRVAVRRAASGDTRIAVRLAQAGDVELLIADARGRIVWRTRAAHRPAGEHTLMWNGCDLAGRCAASGVYAAEVRAGNAAAVVRFVRWR